MKSNRKSRKLVKAAVVVAFAEVSGFTPAFGISSTPVDTVGKDLQEFEVVSERVRKEVTSTAPLFNLTNERMKTMGITDISDALHRLPGINIRDYGGAGV